MWKYHSAVESVLCLISVSSDLDRNRKDASTASPLQATTCLEMLQIVASNIFAQFHVNCRVICVLRSIYIIREIRIVRLVCLVLLPLSEGVAAVVAHPTARGVRLINAGKREPMDSAMRRSAEGVSQWMPHSVCMYPSPSVCLSVCLLSADLQPLVTCRLSRETIERWLSNSPSDAQHMWGSLQKRLTVVVATTAAPAVTTIIRATAAATAATY